MRPILTALALVVAAAPALAQPVPVEPIDDLQRLFIEDTVALIHPPGAEPEARAQALMEQARAARSRGENGQLRQALAEVHVLLAGGQWNVDAAFVASLALRPGHIVWDPSVPLVVEIGQRFGALPAAGRQTFELGLRRKGSSDITWHASAAPLQADFAEAPLRMMLPSIVVPDGSYDLVLRVRSGQRLLGHSALGLHVVNGLQGDLADISRRSGALQMRDAVKSTLGCPENLADTLDDRTRQAVDLDWRALLDRTKAMLAEVEEGRDPLLRAKGDVTRCYASTASGRAEPFRLYVPRNWDGNDRLPLVVLLHGSNADHNRPLASGAAIALAEQYGWALLSPMGYSPNSGWGNHLPVVLANGTMPLPRPSTIAGVVLPKDGVDPEPAEQDVYDALREVRRDYPIDPRRIYLAGNSMGGEGVWHLAQRQPGLWAAVAAGAGAIAPRDYPYARLGKLPVLGVHGDHDEIIAFAATQEMIERLNQAGGRGTMLAVPGGPHRAFDTALGNIFAWFAPQARRQDTAEMETDTQREEKSQ